jgi:hypothetical protein
MVVGMSTPRLRFAFPTVSSNRLPHHHRSWFASVNTHRTFFGERCSRSLPSGGPVSTSCVGFGIERWLHALAVHVDGDWNQAQGAVEKAEESPA